MSVGGRPPSEFRVLLAVDSLGPGCDAEQALAQLEDVGATRVDVVHVVKPGTLTSQVRPPLPDTLASHTRATLQHHVVEDDDPAAGIARLCRNGDFDLIMAPASERGTLWLPWRHSVRAAILRRSPVPVWTSGARPAGSATPHQVRHVGCYVSLETGGDRHVGWATAFAKRLGARLHFLHVVPPLDDGTIADAFVSDRPLLHGDAHARMATLIGDGDEADAAVAVGGRTRELRRLIRAMTIDLLCIPSHDAVCGRQMSPGLRTLPCPVVCCP